ncbi:hypothetical protein BWGOE8_31790 [Bacillus mycoides]|uniref:Uncharacterized protein n=1 Tax=Bacillus mycoides TaxID=1405 RepID=A0A1E8B5Z1_BACMY|nr:hypothetical protein BWGOE8_31790 [Bacillus mycoides]OFD77597.1 hypothetical protein BWGOE9_31850 [Bacillus mycoides]OFD78997.1 hypothetical protein BWGOE10_32270 [Bacillus mycoides]
MLKSFVDFLIERTGSLVEEGKIIVNIEKMNELKFL